MLKYIIFLLAIICISIVYSCDMYPYKQGQLYYQQQCANCHLENGQGLKGLIPPLAGADYLQNSRNLLPCIIRNGLKDSVVVNGVTYGTQQMPAMPKLTDFEITNILNYINTSWGNNLPTWTLEEVRKSLEQCR